MHISQRPDYTFKYNAKLGRHGWLRLTPAYSVKLVQELIEGVPEDSFILDPFSGTATTGVVAAEHNLSAHCFDINPFLVWFGNAKCKSYSCKEITDLRRRVKQALSACSRRVLHENWLPNIHNITRWWCPQTLKILGALRQALVYELGEPRDNDVSALAWIAFCRLVIETSSAAFNHVSMSFHDTMATFDIVQIKSLYIAILEKIIETTSEDLPGNASVHAIDATRVSSVNGIKYSHVITSPPYPNRVSYIRELRPYMYWTKFLGTASQAGELDWKAVGGSWGVATSRLQGWRANGQELPDGLEEVVNNILRTGEKNAGLMAAYVLKYFHDMHNHISSLGDCLKPGAVLAYIVGNSSFYGVQVHTHKMLENSMIKAGFKNVGSRIVRKRNSKKELFEYCIFGTWQETKYLQPAFFTHSDSGAEQLTLFDQRMV